ncbi:hypothetical protein [Nocardioides sp. T2.26MG-1]|uniref:hypothetical protein n=1 Tax=Nocardioides sp. T2.26MG-1 TaxID=3041166 RepID=UPI00247768B8|nr:hypothetical protein [Nocardioides sp. T2.26MG-1]CAI9407936.1 hypothetical protein HIDPHFAB_04887 [Nocardioides sp. T2.26MG-1]
MRAVLGAAGVVIASYGGWLLVTRGHDLRDVAVWLAAGVVLHDAVLALATLALGALATRLVPRAARAPVAVGSVVLGSVTLLAVPVLGRFGAREDNPTLLDRDYTAGWLALAGLTVLAVLVATLVRSRTDREGGAGGPDPRRRRRPHGA